MDNKAIADWLVSVIVPVYNAAAFLDKSVSSLLRQTHSNIEVILVDDGSSDDSLKKCREWEKTDSRVRTLVHEKNMGSEAARNDALDVMKGQWVMFLDADDEYDAQAVEKMLSFALNKGLSLVLAPFYKIVDGQRELCEAKIAEGVWTNEEFAKRCLLDIPWEVLSCVGSKLYSADFIRGNKVLFDPYYRYNEDGAFIIKCLSLVDKVGYCNFPFYFYLIRVSGSTQSTYRPDMYSNLIRTDGFFRAYLEGFGQLSDEQRHALDNKELVTLSNSLRNEIRFGNIQRFREVLRQAREKLDPGEYIRIPGLSLKQKVTLLLMRFRMDGILYFLLKLYSWR